MQEILPFQPYQSYKDSKIFNDRCGSVAIPIKEKYWKEYGFTLICQEQIRTLVHQLKGLKVLDAGSGSGFISYELKHNGIDVTAVDTVNPLDPKAVSYYGIKNIWQLDIVGSAVEQLPGDYDAVILAWPPHRETFAWEVAFAMDPGQLLFYQGEASGGCTGDQRFHNYIKHQQVWRPVEEYSDALDQHQLNFINNWDRWQVFQKTRK